jgi:hypothetical protein
MSKAARVTRLTPTSCEKIQALMLEACKTIAADHGLVIESAGWRGLEPGFAFEPSFRVSIPAPDGKPLNLEKEMFALLAEQYGLEATDFGREFIASGERFRITGIDPRRPKYPISVERIPDRRGFKFTAQRASQTLTFTNRSSTWPKSQLRADGAQLLRWISGRVGHLVASILQTCRRAPNLNDDSLRRRNCWAFTRVV